MDQEKIVIVSGEKDLERVEKVLDSIKQINNSLIQGKIIYGRVGQDTLLSFNTDKQYYRFVIDKLKLNKVKVVSNEEEIEKKKAKSVQQKSRAAVSRGWADLQKKPTQTSPINRMVEEGRYKDIIRITKDIRNGQANIDEARKMLPIAVNNAIETASTNFYKHSHRQADSIETLVEISGDEFLKVPRYIEFVKRAANTVVDLLATRRDQLYKLINICNNNQIHYIGPVKAAVKFYEIMSKDHKLFDDDITYAVKKLNLRRLLICFPMVEHELTDEEHSQFNQFVDFISSKR